MNLDLCNQLIVKKLEKEKLIYVLENEDILYQTGFKVLQNIKDSCLVTCTKVMYNGKPKLIYDISKFQSLEMLMDEMQPKIFAVILNNLFKAIDEVKNNGFIQCENILINFDKIYVDVNTYKVYLIYLPIILKDTSLNPYSIEFELKNLLQQSLVTYPNIKDEIVENLCEHMTTNSIVKQEIDIKSVHESTIIEESVDLKDELIPNQIAKKKKNKQHKKKSSSKKISFKKVLIILSQVIIVSAVIVGLLLFEFTFLFKMIISGCIVLMLTLEIVLYSILSKKKKKTKEINQENLYSQEGGATELLDEIFIPQLVFSSIKNSDDINIIIDKKEFTIGKSENEADGVISINNAISRKHCMILHKECQHYIMDMNSSNGTFVNGKRLIGNQKLLIKDGDKIKLANSEFIIKSL